MVKSTDAEEKPYTVTLRKYQLTHRQTDQTPPSRWMIVGIQQGG